MNIYIIIFSHYLVNFFLKAPVQTGVVGIVLWFVYAVSILPTFAIGVLVIINSFAC